MKLLNLLIIGLCFVNLSCAQNAQSDKQNQIAFIDSSVFYDERVGIIPLILAIKPLNEEFKPRETELKEMIEKQRDLSAELSRTASSVELSPKITKEMIDKKTIELNNLEYKIKTKLEETKILFEKRKKELTKNLRDDIGLSIKQFAKEKGYIIVLDNSENLFFEDSTDVTIEFIKFYNSSPKREKLK